MPYFGKQLKPLFLGSGEDPGNCCPQSKASDRFPGSSPLPRKNSFDCFPIDLPPVSYAGFGFRFYDAFCHVIPDTCVYTIQNGLYEYRKSWINSK
jgi:hypothetical protein